MKPVILKIPKPCHEDWNKMTPVGKGRNCDKCAKQVIDFSLMSDRQILEMLSSSKGKLCGKFNSDQLDRTLHEPVKPVKKKIWGLLFSFLIPLFSVTKAKAQTIGKIAAHEQPVQPRQIEKGVKRISPGLINSTTQKQIIITRPVHPLQTRRTEAEIIVKEKDTNFKIIQPHQDLKTNSLCIKSDIKMLEGTLGEVIVVVGGVKRKSPLSKPGLFAAGKIIKALVGMPSYKIYPNPVKAGSECFIELPGEGNFNIQLSDTQSKLIVRKEEHVTGKQKFSLSISPNIVGGIYYLQVQSSNKAAFTQKIIIQ
ncbi:MAG: type sorting protein [Chitinophagaceae bacterium]|nr:type sorting protein [Chitinophagaceae bacterium]